MTRIILDTEFTGLHQHTGLISLALVAATGQEFYAEFTDFDAAQLTPWLTENVIPKLWLQNGVAFNQVPGGVYLRGNTETIREALKKWLVQFEIIEIWADVLAYDWVLFCELFGGALAIPQNIFYAPFDLATLFKLKGLINPTTKFEADINRFTYAGHDPLWQHNALMDAKVELECFKKLMDE
jgi:hypothetical protein